MFLVNGEIIIYFFGKRIFFIESILKRNRSGVLSATGLKSLITVMALLAVLGGPVLVDRSQEPPQPVFPNVTG